MCALVCICLDLEFESFHSCNVITWTTCSPPTCCQPTRADLDQATLQKLQFCRCCQTFSWLLTVAMWLPWSFWIFQLHSTRLIMRFCCSIYRPPTASVTRDVAHRWIICGRHHWCRRWSVDAATESHNQPCRMQLKWYDNDFIGMAANRLD